MSSSNSVPLRQKRVYARPRRRKDFGDGLGPHSEQKRFEALDHRSKHGRLIKNVTEDLISHLGGDVSYAERLIIHLAAVRVCRLALLTENMLDGVELSTSSDQIVLAWMSGLRQDLVTLGLERRAKNVSFDHIIDKIKKAGADVD